MKTGQAVEKGVFMGVRRREIAFIFNNLKIFTPSPATFFRVGKKII